MNHFEITSKCVEIIEEKSVCSLANGRSAFAHAGAGFILCGRWFLVRAHTSRNDLHNQTENGRRYWLIANRFQQQNTDML